MTADHKDPTKSPPGSDHGDVVADGEDPFSMPSNAPKDAPPAETAAPPPAAHAYGDYDSDDEQPAAAVAQPPPPAAAAASSSSVSGGGGSGAGDDGLPPGVERCILGGEHGVQPQHQFKVCDPRMTMPDSAFDLAYWIYTVHVKTDAEAWVPESKQGRRYSDFLWLRDQLCADYPGAVVPPLPEKNVKGNIEKIMLTDANLLSYRQRYLQKFLSAVAVHHLCKHSHHLQSFCQAEAADFEQHKVSAKRETAEATSSQGGGAVQKAKQGWFNVFKKKNAAAPAAVSEADTQYVCRKRTSSFHNHLHVLLLYTHTHTCSQQDADVAKNLEARKAYAREMEDSLHNAFDKLKRHTETRSDISKSMGELANYLTQTGELESRADPVLAEDLKHSGEYTTKLSRVYMEYSTKENAHVSEVIAFYAGMFAAVKDTVSALQKLQGNVAFLADELNSSEAALAKAPGDKRAKAEETRDKALTRHQASVTKYKGALTLFNAEWSKFHATKQRDFKNLHAAFAGIQVHYAREQEQLQHAPIQPAVF